MITVLFFASIREQLGVEKLELALPEQSTTLADLRQQLINSHAENWQAVLAQHNIVKAVNQEVADDDCVLADGDEIAFFPPVTGG